MNKYLFTITLIVVKLGLILPYPAHAWVFDPFKKAIKAVTEHFGAIVTLLLSIFIAYLIGFILLYLITSLLDWVINQQVAWLTLGGNEMVEAGFAFTSGIANMLLILILLAIAFATILKITNWPIEKLLPRLIVVALLLNFSLVFIGMLVDISHIFFNTILNTAQEAVKLPELPEEVGLPLVHHIMFQFFGGTQGAMEELGKTFTALAVTAVIPFAGVANIIFKVTGFVAYIIPHLAIWIPQIVIMYLMILVLFPFLFIFVARVYIIQILAILSPLAFLCLILPTTKKHFDTWLKHLVAWTFVGVALLFFLVLGAGFTDVLFPEGDPGVPLFGFDEIPDLISSYLFIIIYFVIVLMITKKTMPEGAQAMITSASQVGKIALGTGVGFIAGNKFLRRGEAALGRGAGKFGEGWEKKGAELEKEAKAGPRGWFKRTGSTLMKGTGSTFQKLSAITTADAEGALNQQLTEARKGMKDKSDNELYTFAHAEKGTVNGTAALREIVDRGDIDDFFKYLTEKIHGIDEGGKKRANEEIAMTYRELINNGQKKEANQLASACPQLHKEFGITKDTLTNKEKEDFLDNTQDNLEKEFEKLLDKDKESLLNNGVLSNGKAFISSVVGELDEENTKALARAYSDQKRLTADELTKLLGGPEELTKKRNKKELEKLIKKIAASPESIKNMHSDAYTGEELIPLIQKYFGARQISIAAGNSDEARKNIEKIFQNKIDRSVDNGGGFENLAKENPSAAAYIVSGASQGTGVVVNTGKTDREARQIIKDTKKSTEQIIKELQTEREKIESEIKALNEEFGELGSLFMKSPKQQDREVEIETIIKKLNKKLKGLK